MKITKILFLTILVLFLSNILKPANELSIVEKWEHNKEILGKIVKSFIDEDGNVILCIYKDGLHLVSKSDTMRFAAFGQANNEVAGAKVIDLFPGEGKSKKKLLAILERMDRFKFFKKIDGTYKESGVKWIKKNQFPHFIKNGVYYDEKWFITGNCLLNFHPEISKQSLLVALNKNGDPIANIIKRELKHEDDKKGFYIDYLITANPAKNELYFLSEHELNVSVVSPSKLRIVRTVELEKPKNYTSMPAEFYDRLANPQDIQNTIKTIETWKTSYSRITKAVTFKNHLILQILNCQSDSSNYNLLVYNLDDFKLILTIPINDLFLGVWKESLFFFAGGNPGYHEDATRLRINIFKFSHKWDE